MNSSSVSSTFFLIHFPINPRWLLSNFGGFLPFQNLQCLQDTFHQVTGRFESHVNTRYVCSSFAFTYSKATIVARPFRSPSKPIDKLYKGQSKGSAASEDPNHFFQSKYRCCSDNLPGTREILSRASGLRRVVLSTLLEILEQYVVYDFLYLLLNFILKHQKACGRPKHAGSRS